MRRFSRVIGNLLLLAGGTGLLLLLLVVVTGSGQFALPAPVESPTLAQVPSSAVTAPGPPFGPVADAGAEAANADAGADLELLVSRPTPQPLVGLPTPTEQVLRSTSDASPPIAAPSAPTRSPAVPEPAVAPSAGGPAPAPPAPVDAQVETTDSSDPLLPAPLELGHASGPAVDSVPITGVTLPRIGLVADVVPAPLAELEDGATWLVPAFKAGHAQYTAGAGQSGNAIVLGHVTSRSLGNVFERLYLGRVGDVVLVFSGPEQVFEYRVVEVQAVSRTDVSVLQPTDTPSISLITCTGAWNAALHDYMERLVVRAELTS